MKKKFLILGCALIAQMLCSNVFAATPSGFISLRKQPGGIVGRIPGPRPLAEEIPLFSAFQDVDELIITSEAVSAVVTVNIYNSVGAVVETVTASVAVGGEISVDITSLPEGAYILEIAFDDIVYVGQFEL